MRSTQRIHARSARLGLVGALGALGLASLSAASGSGPVHAATPAATHAPLSAAQISAYRKEFGYLPGDPQDYLALKQQAQDRLYPNGNPSHNAAAPAVSAGPSPSWQGLNDINDAPPDANGAVGPTEYVEMVNADIGVYRRDGTTIGTQGLISFVGSTTANSATDPVVLWDAGTNRFYYQYLDVGTSTNYVTRWGFSKTSSPSANSSDWCQYTADFGYGADLPDYPKMGQTADFLLIGVNIFPASGTNDSDIDWIAKPQGTAAVTTCPTQASIAKGVLADGINNADATPGFTPVPAIQTDPSSTGYIVSTFDVAAPVPLTQGHDSSTNVPGLGASTFVTVYSVTNNGGTPVLSAPHAVTVASFQTPINATQMGNTFQIDTLDGRLNHAVSGVDPSRGGGVAVWTNHAVMGGAGAEERWYEIDPVAASLLQPEGVITSATAFNYNGAISPDRAVSGASARFGGSMALGLTMSGPTANPTDIMVTKVLDGPQSAPSTVVVSPNGYDDFSCSESVAGARTACRWGDYGGGTPDPTPAVPSDSQVGNVWLTNQWDIGIPTNPLCSIDACWQTQIWAANLPQPPPVGTPEAPVAALLIGVGFLGVVAGTVARRRRAVTAR